MRLRELCFHNAGLLPKDYRIRLNRRFTLLLGDNEAGKSTMHRAIDALLFGPSQALVAPGSVAGFDCSAIVEGADGAEATLRRRGRNWATPPSGEWQAWLAPELAGRFRDLFCLSHENLHPEGERFLAAEGTLGSLLFGASTGLRPQALEAALKSVERELKSARGSGAGSSLERQLEEFRAQRARREQVARFQAFERACADLDAAKSALRACDARVVELDRQRQQLARLLGGVPTWQALREARRVLRLLEATGQLPDAAQSRLISALRGRLEVLDGQALERARQALEAKLALERCAPPDPLADLAPAVEGLRGEVAAGEVDRQELGQEERAFDALLVELRQQLQALGAAPQADLLAAAEALLLAEPVRATLAAALQQQQALQDERASRTRTRGEAEQAVRQAAREAAEVVAQDSGPVERALAQAEIAWRAERELGDRTLVLQRKAEDADALRAALGLREAADAGQPVIAPDRGRSSGLEAALSDARAQAGRCAQQLDAADAEMRRRQAEHARWLGVLKDAPTDARIAQARAVRDELWERLSAHWAPGAPGPDAGRAGRDAQAFALAMQQVDLLHDARIAAGESVGKAAAAAAALREAEEVRQDRQRELATARQRLAEAEGQWSAHWACVLTPPANAGEWHARLDAWHALQRERAGLVRERDALQAERDVALADALAHLGAEAAAFGAFASAAALHVALQSELRRRRSIAERARELAQLLRATQEAVARSDDHLARLTQEEQAWAADWQSLARHLPPGLEAHPAAASAWLDAQSGLRRLCADGRRLCGQIAARRERIAGTEARLRELLGEARRLASELPIPPALAPAAAYPLLLETVLAAQARLRERRRCEEALAQAGGEVAACRTQRDAAFSQLHELWQRLGYTEAPDDHAIHARLDTAARAEQARQAVEKLQAALQAHWADQHEDFERQIIEVGEAALRSSHGMLQAEIESALQAQDAARQALLGAEAALAGLDAGQDAVEVEARYASARDRAIDEAEQLHRLALASYLLERAKAEATHSQTHLEQRASGYFATLTAGAFSGLRIDPAAHTLYALGPQGDRTLAQLSTGTGDQIWLALRMAAIVEAARSTPYPLLLDDIFVQFDDARSDAALRMLLDLSEHVQVIAFTHHDHLVDLAQQALPAEHLATVVLPRPDAQARLRVLASLRPRRDRNLPEPAADTPLDEPAPGAAPADTLSRAVGDPVEDLQAWIVQRLRQAASPLGYTELSRAAEEAGAPLDKRVWQAAIGRLVERGRVDKRGEKRGTRYALRAEDGETGPGAG